MAEERIMAEKTIMLRKEDHWYMFNSVAGDEGEILLALLEYAECESYNIEYDEVIELADRLGWTIEMHDNLDLAS